MILGVLLTRGYRLLSVAAILDVFETVNSFLEKDGKQIRFNIQLVGVEEDSLPEHLKKYPC